MILQLQVYITYQKLKWSFFLELTFPYMTTRQSIHTLKKGKPGFWISFMSLCIKFPNNSKPSLLWIKHKVFLLSHYELKVGRNKENPSPELALFAAVEDEWLGLIGTGKFSDRVRAQIGWSNSILFMCPNSGPIVKVIVSTIGSNIAETCPW